MKIKFDSNQPHQTEPVQAVIDLLDGQAHLDTIDIDEIILAARNKDYAQPVLSAGLAIFTNRITIDRQTIHQNLNKIQSQNGLSLVSYDQFKDNGLSFSIEMETGTGKTYVYLKTIYELNQKYGFKKFIIVVPNVAIREGVLKNLEITKSHFEDSYEGIKSPDYFVYEGDKLHRVRDFASSEQLQIMVINIQAFNKETAIFNNTHYKLDGYSPQEVINETAPVVIIDEPQIVDNTDKGKEAIKSLNSLITLRYSATHRELYNQIYRLTPIDAFEKKLVKQIQVDGITASNEFNNAYVKLLEIDNTNGLRAKVRINKKVSEGVKKEDLWVKLGDDLYEKSGERDEYKNSYEIVEITAGEQGYVEFENQILYLNQEIGGMERDIVRIQMKKLIKAHFDKVRQSNKRFKVLSLIFLDKVANYRGYDYDGQPMKGKYAQTFEEEYQLFVDDAKNNIQNPLPVELVHDGYFSQDKTGKNKGRLKDSKGDSSVDADTYNKIMKDKERLLSIDEPLQFIFSHSALGVGWDNPNVFQICTLNETASTIKKRQEIGRGLRLPVDSLGERIRDENINVLTVVCNESYEEFADKLQKEFEDECGIVFGIIEVSSFTAMSLDGQQVSLTLEESITIHNSLIDGGIIASSGKVLKKNIALEDVKNSLPEQYREKSQMVVNKLTELSSIKQIVKKKVEPKVIKLKYSYEELEKLEPFKQLWSRIAQKTRYRIKLNTDDLVTACIDYLNENLHSVSKIKISSQVASLSITSKGVTSSQLQARNYDVDYKARIPNLVNLIKKRTELKASTIIRILKGHAHLSIVFANPQEYIERASQIILDVLGSMKIDGVKYEKIDGEFWNLTQLEKSFEISHDKFLNVEHSIYDAVVFDNSQVEKNFAEYMERFGGKDGNFKLFLKLPNWFKIDTPIGSYNPDWAIVYDNTETLYLVRETKSTKRIHQLRKGENDKIRCGKKHFEAISEGSVSFYDVAIPNANSKDFEVI